MFANRLDPDLAPRPVFAFQSEERIVRASYEVPEELGFSVSDIRIGGRPIEFGAQLADLVQVRLTAVATRFGFALACAGAVRRMTPWR